jgi:hypothetical protein
VASDEDVGRRKDMEERGVFQPWVSWWDDTERTDTPFTTSQPPATVDRPELTHVFCKIRKTHPVSIQMFLSRLLNFFYKTQTKLA